jgi:hypothetical protein
MEKKGRGGIEVNEVSNIPELTPQELDAFMWLVEAKKEIEKAGGYVGLERLQKMSLIEFARIAGCDDLEIKYNRGAYHLERRV